MPEHANRAMLSDADVHRLFERIRAVEPDKDFPVTLKTTWFDTPVGLVVAVADDEVLYLLEYAKKINLERKTAIIRKNLDARLEKGHNPILESIKREMDLYFAGRLKRFETPIKLTGSSFQNSVWEELRTVPFGTTISYADLAASIGRPSAFRAVAQANGQNPLIIVVPCHRVINADGGIGGYQSGIAKKQWLLDFEKSILAGEAAEHG